MSIRLIIHGKTTILVPPDLGLEHLMFMYQNPFCTCWACNGERVVTAELQGLEGLAMLTPCPVCNATGLCAYISLN